MASEDGNITETRNKRRLRIGRLPLILGMILIEMIAIVVVFQILSDVECRLTSVETGCRILRSMVARAVTVAAALLIFFAARKQALWGLRKRARQARGSTGWLFVHLFGLAIIFVPAMTVPQGMMNEVFHVLLVLLTFGAVIATLGLVFWLAKPGAWAAWFREQRSAFAVTLAVGALIPDMATALLPLWGLDSLTRLTFGAVASVLTLFASAPETLPEIFVIGADGFMVQVASQCSGVEGFALTAVFCALYAFLFKDDLRMGRFWAVVLPLALLASWVLNVIRIAVLILIGARGASDLALNGFHSYAGWLFFTVLALGILALVQVTPWLHKSPGEKGQLPWVKDWTVARILPFLIFVLSGIVVFAFWSTPALGYPFRVVVMAAVLVPFAALYRALEWRLDPVALAAGAAVGVAWSLMAQAASSGGETQALQGLAGAAAVIWITARLAGTILLVPLIEELFFRGYVLTRLDRGGLVWRVVAIAVSSALFALLHGRWLEAGGAGVLFALVYLRKGRLGDAVVAHGTANAIVAAWAAASGNWDLI